MPDAQLRALMHGANPMFLRRWSPRAFVPECMPVEHLMAMFEAACWAPSAFNAQPWQFFHAMRNTPEWEPMVGLLAGFNASWAREASALVLIASRKTMDIKDEQVDSWSHSFDAGAAWGYLALQASLLGYQAHAMTGFDMRRAALEVEEAGDLRPEAMVAIGRVGDSASLPERLRLRERPSGRDALDAHVSKASFKQLRHATG